MLRNLLEYISIKKCRKYAAPPIPHCPCNPVVVPASLRIVMHVITHSLLRTTGPCDRNVLTHLEVLMRCISSLKMYFPSFPGFLFSRSYTLTCFLISSCCKPCFWTSSCFFNASSSLNKRHEVVAYKFVKLQYIRSSGCLATFWRYLCNHNWQKTQKWKIEWIVLQP